MQKHFYTHLIKTDDLEIELTQLTITDDEKHQLLTIAHETIHHAVLDTILDELTENDKKHFLQLLAKEQHPEIWGHLRTRVHKVEEKITTRIEHILDLLKKDLQEVKNKK